MSAEAAQSPFAHLSNDEFRQELTKNGIPYGPITATTRKVYERKLQNALEGNPAENGNGSLLNGSASENGNGSMNGNRGSVAAQTPSRESTPLIEKRAQTVVNGNEGGGGQRETSPKPTAGVEEDSDNEEDSAEIARVLTPDEIHKFRSGFRSYTESPATNGSGVRLRREPHSAQPEYYTNNAVRATPTPTCRVVPMLKPFVLPVLAMLVVVGLAVVAFQMRDRLPAIPSALKLNNYYWPNWAKSLMNKENGNVGGAGKE